MEPPRRLTVRSTSHIENTRRAPSGKLGWKSSTSSSSSSSSDEFLSPPTSMPNTPGGSQKPVLSISASSAGISPLLHARLLASSHNTRTSLHSGHSVGSPPVSAGGTDTSGSGSIVFSVGKNARLGCCVNDAGKPLRPMSVCSKGSSNTSGKLGVAGKIEAAKRAKNVGFRKYHPPRLRKRRQWEQLVRIARQTHPAPDLEESLLQEVDGPALTLKIPNRLLLNSIASSPPVEAVDGSPLHDKPTRRRRSKVHNYEQQRVDDYKSFVQTHLLVGDLESILSGSASRTSSVTDIALGATEIIPFGEYLWLHLQAWKFGRPITKAHILESLAAHDSYLCAERKSALSVLNDLRTFTFELTFKLSKSGSGVSDSSIESPIQVLQHLPECSGTHNVFNAVFLTAQKDALRVVGHLLKRYEDLMSLYPHSRAMYADLSEHLDSHVRDRIKVLYIWFNLTRELCRSIRSVGRMFGMHYKLSSISEWPNLDYDSPTEASVSTFATQRSKTNLTPTPSDANLSRLNSSVSVEKLDGNIDPDTLIRSTAAMFQEFVEKSLRKRGMKKVLARVRHMLGRTFQRGRQALVTGTECQSASQNKKGATESPTCNHLVLWASTPATLTLAKSKGMPDNDDDDDSVNTPNTADEARKLLALALSMVDDVDANKFGMNHPEFYAMNLPSFRPSYLFLLRVPVDVVHQWIRLRASVRNALASPDMITVKQLLRDGQDVLESAVEVKCFYQEQIRAVVQSPEKLQNLIVTELSEFEFDLGDMFDVFLEHVKAWVIEWQEMTQESEGEKAALVQSLIPLERYWMFAKRIGVHIRNGEAAAAKHFGEIAQIMLKRLMTFLEQADTEKNWTKRDMTSAVPLFKPPPTQSATTQSDIGETASSPDDLNDGDMGGTDEVMDADEVEDVEEEAEDEVDESDDVTEEQLRDSDLVADDSVESPCPRKMSLAERKQYIFQVCRKLKKLIIEARERSVRALMFAKKLRSDLEASASYSRLVPLEVFLERLRETDHVLLHVELENFPVLVFVRNELVDQKYSHGFVYVELLLSVTCGRNLEDLPCSLGKLCYVLWLRIPPEERVAALDAWKGSTQRLMLDPQMNFSLQQLEVDDVKILTLHPNLLKGQRHAFLRLIGTDCIKMTDDQCSSHEMVSESMRNVKGTAVKIRRQLFAWLQGVEKYLCTEAQALENSEKYVYKNAVIRAYDFVFEFHRALARLLSGKWREQLAGSLRELSLSWINFVLYNREEGKGARPSWASQGIKFMATSLEPRYTQFYTAEEYNDLKTSVDRCMMHLIGRPRSVGSDSPTSIGEWPFPFPSHVLQSCQNPDGTKTIVPEAPPPPPLPAIGRQLSKNPENRIRHAIHQLERRRESALKQQKTIGRVIESKTLQPSQRIAKKKAAFRWQRLSKKIGQGATGEVYTAYNLDTGQVMAVKQISMERLQWNHQALRIVVDEITNFEAIRHPNLVRYYGVEVHREELLIFMEYCSEGTLEAACKDGLSPELIRYYTAALLSGVYELHRRGILHRDIKTANIFLTSDKMIKLGDFGCSVKIREMTVGTMENEITGTVGTVPYMAPEIISSSGGQGRASDVWSIACVVLEMATGKPPWQDKTSYQVMWAVGNGAHPPIPDSINPLCREFLLKCFHHKPDKRWSVEQLMNHPFANVKIPEVGSMDM